VWASVCGEPVKGDDAVDVDEQQGLLAHGQGSFVTIETPRDAGGRGRVPAPSRSAPGAGRESE
jgi:hypothetical protein